MKLSLVVLCLLVSISINAQNERIKSNEFIRVYDLQGKKIGKGHIFSVSDTSLQLNRAKGMKVFQIPAIGFIKTKRAGGNNVIVGGMVGSGAMAMVSAVSNDPDGHFFRMTNGEAGALGAFFGGMLGAGVGGLSIPFKKSKFSDINGDTKKWIEFQRMIEN